MADFRRHAVFRGITMYLQRVMLDKLIENDTPATDKLSIDWLPRNESDASQEELKEYYNEILQVIENHHHMKMNKFVLKEGDPVDKNGLDFLTNPPTTEGKSNDAQPAKTTGKDQQKPEPPPEGTAT